MHLSKTSSERSARTRRPTQTTPSRRRSLGGDAGTSRVQRPLGPVLDFMRALWAVDHGLLTVSRAMRSKLGVTGPQRLVIRIVGRYPGISAGELASILHLHPSSLTGILKRLVELRVLVRSASPDDARRAVLSLSAKGRALDGLKTGTVEAKVQRALQALDARDVATAETVLRAIARTLGKE